MGSSMEMKQNLTGRKNYLSRRNFCNFCNFNFVRETGKEAGSVQKIEVFLIFHSFLRSRALSHLASREINGI